jgi:cytochrome c oxidase subunit IV
MSAHEHTTHEHSHGGPKVYIATLAALLFLTVVTVFVAGFDFGNINIVVAVAIATLKASLVVLIFMHLRHDKPVNAIIAISGFVFLGLLLLFSLLDIEARNDPTPGTLKVAPKSAPGVIPAAVPPATPVAQ